MVMSLLDEIKECFRQYFPRKYKCRILRAKSLLCLVLNFLLRNQGDQIGRFFAHWVIVNLGQFFDN
jgi:hypothetical protein